MTDVTTGADDTTGGDDMTGADHTKITDDRNTVRNEEIVRATGRRRAINAAVIIALVLCVGVAAGALLLPSRAPSSLAPSASVAFTPATKMTTVDDQSASLLVTTGDRSSLSSGYAGTITESRCTPGAGLVSGTVLMSVNDKPLILIASPRPLWRDLNMGDRGSDVKALQTELARLGYAARADGSFGAQTLNAIRRLGRESGDSDAVNWPGLPLSRFIWMPAASVRAESCPLAVGSVLQAGGTVATLPRGIVSARLDPRPEDVMSGAREVVVDDTALPTDESGSVTGESSLATLTASAAFRSASGGAASNGAASGGAGDSAAVSGGADGSAAEGGDTGGAAASGQIRVSVRYRLRAGLTVFSVPAAALIGSAGDRACVITETGRLKVRVAGSQLGQSFVIPDSGGLSTVAIAPDRRTVCR